MIKTMRAKANTENCEERIHRIDALARAVEDLTKNLNKGDHETQPPEHNGGARPATQHGEHEPEEKIEEPRVEDQG